MKISPFKKYLLTTLVFVVMFCIGWTVTNAVVTNSENPAQLSNAIDKIKKWWPKGMGISPTGLDYTNNWDGPCWDEYEELRDAQSEWSRVQTRNSNPSLNSSAQARREADDRLKKARKAFDECNAKNKGKRP